ncbi:MAG TPA: rod shape-determining protein MreC [Spirochaetota bacterium]|nr:rod shape-determining protein MreC [Spirochaetota bacterium]
MEFLVRHKSIIAFLAFSLFCFVSLSIRSSALTFSFEGIGSLALTPFQKGYYSVQRGVHMLWAGFTELGDVREELVRTRDKLQHYEAMAEELGEIKRENDRLRQLLDMQQRVEYQSIPATIISKDPDNWFRTIVINRGSIDGIKVNMPVIAFRGDEKAVVGKVIEVRGRISRILPIISTDMKLGALFQENRFPGLCFGYAPSSTLVLMDYISKSATIKFGDVIITSGQGGVFPQGLLVGKVIKTLVTDTSAYQKALVRPIIDFNQVEMVYVIKKELDPELSKMLESEEP